MLTTPFEIRDLQANDKDTTVEIAKLLVEGFKEHWPNAWPNIQKALEEVQESLQKDRISRYAVAHGQVLGWVSGTQQYGGNVWEVHPLIVRVSQQRRGIGKALMADFERQVYERGGMTLLVGADDENHMTSIGGVYLYPHPLAHLMHMTNLRGHPFEFYQKCGFSIVGVVPDANGLGKPDILMAKRVTRPKSEPSSK